MLSTIFSSLSMPFTMTEMTVLKTLVYLQGISEINTLARSYSAYESHAVLYHYEFEMTSEKSGLLPAGANGAAA